MGRFYVELSLTVYANDEDEAERIAEELCKAIPMSDDYNDMAVEDIEADEDNEDEG